MEAGTKKVARRDLPGPATRSEVSPNRFWILETIVRILIVLVLGTYTSIRDGISYLFRKQKSVKGKVVVITGTGRGLGRRLALKMSRLGAYVACIDINTKNNEETVQLINQEGGKAQAFTANVAKIQQVEELYKDITKKLGPADILVNNAALIMATPIEDMSYDEIRAFYEVNCMSAAFMTKAFLGDMRKRNSGHIVGISSMAARATLPWLSLYCSTKAGLAKFLDCLHVELNMNPDNQIKVTTVYPFFINTSAQYTKWFRSVTPILGEGYVVHAILTAILYEKSSIFIPSYLSFLNIMDGLLPLHYFNLNAKYLSRDVRIPNKSERETLAYSDIVDDTSAETNKK